VQIIKKVSRLDDVRASEFDDINEYMKFTIGIDHPNLQMNVGFKSSPSELQVFQKLFASDYITLESYISEKIYSLSEQIIGQITHQIYKGLVKLHSCNITHGNLTPSNIYICPGQLSGLPHVMLNDYGADVLEIYAIKLMISMPQTIQKRSIIA
jgi:serine/threonine protein kinase